MPTPLVTLARVLLGLPYLVLGLNHFVKFFGMPAPPSAAEAFLGGLASTSWVFPVVKGAEVVGGALLVLGWAQPLALVLLAPVTIGIVGYAFDFGGGIKDYALPYTMGGLHLLLILRHRSAWGALFFSEVDEEE
jgi:uncharacterized membrane protein YphA (DoxX/SURF4 family)